MIWSSTSGITIRSSERPNIVCGSNRLIPPRWRMSRASGAKPDGSSVSLGLEGIAGAADGLQIARIARVGLDLAAQPGHLHIDVADIAAELRRLRQILARYGVAGPRREAGQEPRFGGGQTHHLAAAEQFAAGEVEAEDTEAKDARGIVRDPAALDDIADAQHQFARLERLCQVVVGALFEPEDP